MVIGLLSRCGLQSGLVLGMPMRHGVDLMRNKMITLDPSAYEYAQKMTNFSGWVRNQIAAHARGESLSEAIRQRNFWKAKYDLLKEAEK